MAGMFTSIRKKNSLILKTTIDVSWMPSRMKSSFHYITSPLIRSHDDTFRNGDVPSDPDWLRHLSPPGCCGHV